VLNVLLKHVSPLFVSTSMLLEPIIGSVIGYFCGLQQFLSIYTWLGGGILMISLIFFVIGENKRSAIVVDEELLPSEACSLHTGSRAMTSSNEGLHKYGSIPDYSKRSISFNPLETKE